MPIAITTRRPAAGAHEAPLLFVHGAWHGRWCWEPFLDAFAELGRTGHALDLRGHGDSDGRLRTASIADYVEDVRSVAVGLEQPPILVGHSMGGWIVQQYVARHQAAAAVLIAPVPVHGVYQATLRVAKEVPGPFAKANLTLNLGPVVASPRHARALLFRPEDARPEVDAAIGNLQDESYRAYLDMMVRRVRPRQVRNPVMVIGGTADRLFSAAEFTKTAAAYDAPLHLIPEAPHDVMLDTAGPDVVAVIAEWLESICH